MEPHRDGIHDGFLVEEERNKNGVNCKVTKHPNDLKNVAAFDRVMLIVILLVEIKEDAGLDAVERDVNEIEITHGRPPFAFEKLNTSFIAVEIEWK